MSRRDKWRVFGDEGRHLDRFGLVLGLTALSVSVLALIDLDDATESLRSELGWMVVMFTVGATLIAAIRASGVTKRWRMIAWISIGSVLLAGMAFSVIGLSGESIVIQDFTRPSVPWVIIAVLSPILVLHRILRHPDVTRETVAGAVAAYLLIALAFSYAFLYLDRLTSEPFFGVAESTSSYMYFSLVTITTVGYGDLAPVTDFARYLATSEAVFGQVVLVTVVARVVSMYSRPGDRSPAS